jgi:hypothetical protein
MGLDGRLKNVRQADRLRRSVSLLGVRARRATTNETNTAYNQACLNLRHASAVSRLKTRTPQDTNLLELLYDIIDVGRILVFLKAPITDTVSYFLVYHDALHTNPESRQSKR